MSSSESRKRIGLVIGAGSIKCSAVVGILQVLERNDIDIDLVVGCSGGSIYAALIALGYSGEILEPMTYNLWNKELTQKYRPKAIFKLLFPKMSGFNELFGLIDDRRVMGRFSELYGDQGFSDTKIPLHILATDFTSGEQVQISHGRLIDAVRASIAIPIIFKPEIIDGRVLVDGGLADLMPVDVAIKEGADIIIALGFEAPLQKQINSVLGYTSQVTSIMFNNLLRSNFAFHNIAHHKEILTIIPRFEEQIGISEDSKVPTLIKEGAQAMEEQLPYLKKLLEMDVD